MMGHADGQTKSSIRASSAMEIVLPILMAGCCTVRTGLENRYNNLGEPKSTDWHASGKSMFFWAGYRHEPL
jgi:hypothetical protein